MTRDGGGGERAGARSPAADLWALDPAVAYLNHGSFGACPVPVLELQSRLRAEMEREAVDFLVRALPDRLAAVRAALGRFMGASPASLVFVPNATTGVNAALRSWDLGPGDEILTTDHTYGACRKTIEFVASRRGAKVNVARVPFPLEDEDQVVGSLLAAATPRTRVAMIDHVTSPTALVFPIERIVPALAQRGIETIVDGAHALGQVPLALDRMGVACYTANAHKWLCAPKGAAVLHVREDLQSHVRPVIVSHGYDPLAPGVRFREEWDWTGTVDPTPWLAIPECLRLLESLDPGGWPGLMAANRALALKGRAILMETLGVTAPCPEGMVGSMASLPLPAAAAGSPVARLPWDQLAGWTRERGIESWFFPWPCAGGKLVRLSAQAYNHESQYRALASLLAEALLAG